VRFCIAPEILARRPDYLVGVVVARLVDNRRRGDDPASALLEKAVAAARQEPPEGGPGTLWNAALEQFGVDTAQHPPASERLLERVRAGQALPSVNSAVDLANAIALRHGVSLGVHDLDATRGDITVRLALPGDSFLPYGTEAAETVTVGEPVYADERDVRTRWWISRQSRTGRADERSRTLFFPIDGFAGQTEDRVRAAVEELAALLREHLDARTTTAFVDAAHPCCTLLRFPLIGTVPADGDAIDELLGRGVVDLIKREELEPRLRNGETLKVKFGIDPTGPLLHVGRATQLFKLRQFQELGHRIQFLVGSFTGMLGDPSDKSAYRRQLSAAEVQANMERYVEQAGRIIDIGKTEVVYNADWLGALTFAQVIELASNFTVQQMLERENFHLRQVAGKPIFLHELLYPLMQGYDSVVLRSDVEVGGTDQLFNLLAGRLLQERAGQRPQSVLTLPLIPGTNGEKMSTSAGNVVNILDPPREQYFALMRMHDEQILTYFETCTTVPLAEIRQLAEAMENGELNPREAKARLARTMVTQFHSPEAALEAEREFNREVSQHERPADLPEVTVTAQPRRLTDLMVELCLAPSKGAARRLVEQGGVEVGGQRIREPNAQVTPADGLVLRVGKAGWAKLKVDPR
jgi:tyrosyl-tRNA synthetase